jgi:hypothetical protein
MHCTWCVCSCRRQGSESESPRDTGRPPFSRGGVPPYAQKSDSRRECRSSRLLSTSTASSGASTPTRRTPPPSSTCAASESASKAPHVVGRTARDCAVHAARVHGPCKDASGHGDMYIARGCCTGFPWRRALVARRCVTGPHVHSPRRPRHLPRSRAALARPSGMPRPCRRADRPRRADRLHRSADGRR